MQDAPALVRQHQKHVQDLEPNCRHDEEIDRHHRFQVIVQERPPGLRGWLAAAHHILIDARLADVDAEFEQFAVNVRRSQSGLSRFSMRISSRTSFETAGRPGLPRRIFQLQNKPKPLRCQSMTVAAFMMETLDCHPFHTDESQTQRKRSAGLSLGRLTERWSTPI